MIRNTLLGLAAAAALAMTASAASAHGYYGYGYKSYGYCKKIFVGYRTGLRGPGGVVQPYPNHEDHMHVRFHSHVD